MALGNRPIVLTSHPRIKGGSGCPTSDGPEVHPTEIRTTIAANCLQPAPPEQRSTVECAAHPLVIRQSVLVFDALGPRSPLLPA